MNSYQSTPISNTHASSKISPWQWRCHLVRVAVEDQLWARSLSMVSTVLIETQSAPRWWVVVMETHLEWQVVPLRWDPWICTNVLELNSENHPLRVLGLWWNTLTPIPMWVPSTTTPRVVSRTKTFKKWLSRWTRRKWGGSDQIWDWYSHLMIPR